MGLRPSEGGAMGEVTLQEVLDAREARAASQRRLLEKFGRPLVGLNMNIAI